MKSLILLALMILNVLTSQAVHAQHHAKHNMLLFGHDKIYASHIVYKEPHNYQVILNLELRPNIKKSLADEMKLHPNDEMIFLLDNMDISQIQLRPKISGQVFRRSSHEGKYPIFDHLEVEPKNYSVIYFDKLPVDLSGKAEFAKFLTSQNDKTCTCKPARIKCDDSGTRGYYCQCSDGTQSWKCR